MTIHTDYFAIVVGVLQGYSLGLFLFIIDIDLARKTSTDIMKENRHSLKKARSRRYPTRITTDGNYTYDLALLTSSPALADYLLHNLKPEVRGIGLST